MIIKDIGLCECGAASIYGVDDMGKSQEFCISSETLKEKFPHVELPDATVYHNCNHCVNHWGVDLCACGSGEAPDECEEGHSCCGSPMQAMPEELDSLEWA